MDIPKSIDLTLKVAEIAKGGEIFILKMPKLYIDDFVNVAINTLAIEFGYKPNKIKIKMIGQRMGEKFHEELMTKQEINNSYEIKNMSIIPSEIKVGNKQMNILVIGSKQNPKISKEFDHIVYINGSIYIYEKIKKPLQSTHVVSNYCFEEDWGWKKYFKNQFKNKYVNNLVIIKSRDININDIVRKLKEINYKYDNLVFLSRKERTDITNSIIGKLYLIYTAITMLDNLKSKLINIIKLILKKETGGYKPSTGVFTCLYCLDKYSNIKKLIISGVSLTKGTHVYDVNHIYPDSHNHFDKYILKKLSKRNNVYTTEKDLSEITNIQYLEK